MSIITLTSDWGQKSNDSAIIKACILKQIANAQIVDISHSIPAFDIHQAAFILKNAYPYFPKGSVHIIGVDAEASVKNPHIVAYHNEQYFIGADNGIFNLLFDKEPAQVIEIDVIQDTNYFTFPERDVFVKVACHILLKNNISELGKPIKISKQLQNFLPSSQENVISGKVIFIDAYENAVTNIHESFFKKHQKNRKFKIHFRGYILNNKIFKYYSEGKIAEPMAIFGSNGYLEISMNKGNAAGLLGLSINDVVRIEFE